MSRPSGRATHAELGRVRLRELDEAVLYRLVGGPTIMREQLDHLTEVAQLPHVAVSVHPFRAGAHSSIGAAFTLLRFADTLGMNCVYLENDRGALYLERPAQWAVFSAGVKSGQFD